MVIFADGVSFDTIAVYGGSMLYQSANRLYKEIAIPATLITLDEANALAHNAEAISKFTVTYDKQTAEGVVSESAIYENYTKRIEVRGTQINGIEVVCIKLAQESDLEIAQAKQAQDIANTELALIELAGMLV